MDPMDGPPGSMDGDGWGWWNYVFGEGHSSNPPLGLGGGGVVCLGGGQVRWKALFFFWLVLKRVFLCGSVFVRFLYGVVFFPSLN